MRPSFCLWALAFAVAVGGLALAMVGIYSVSALDQYEGLYLVLFGPLLSGSSGIIAVIASSKEAEG